MGVQRGRHSRRIAAHSFLGPRILDSLDEIDAPEVMRQVGVRDVLVGHVEIALVAPAFAPGVADDENLLEVVEAHGRNSVAAPDLVAGLRHHHDARLPRLLAGEAGEHRKTEPEDVRNVKQLQG